MITRTWTANDANGNAISCDQIITVEETLPSIECPADVTISCDASTDPSNTGEAMASDSTAITFTDVVQSGTGNNAVITRTWTATDTNENAINCDQVITLEDTTAPEITCPDVSLIAPELPDFTGDASIFDNCSTNVVVTQDPVAGTVFDVNEVITVTLTATDENGNESSCSFDVTVDPALSVGDAEALDNSISLYPNPTPDLSLIHISEPTRPY